MIEFVVQVATSYNPDMFIWIDKMGSDQEIANENMAILWGISHLVSVNFMYQEGESLQYLYLLQEELKTST